MQIIGRSVGAALAMGNACVLKPAEEACLTALAFADLALKAGLPKGALNVVPGLGAEAGAALSAHSGIDHLSFTGSVATSRLVQMAAAQNVIPVTLSWVESPPNWYLRMPIWVRPCHFSSTLAFKMPDKHVRPAAVFLFIKADMMK